MRKEGFRHGYGWTPRRSQLVRQIDEYSFIRMCWFFRKLCHGNCWKSFGSLEHNHLIPEFALPIIHGSHADTVLAAPLCLRHTALAAIGDNLPPLLAADLVGCSVHEWPPSHNNSKVIVASTDWDYKGCTICRLHMNRTKRSTFSICSSKH